MIEIPSCVERVLDRLWAAGYEAYIVGGCIRDALMGLTPHDYDITTSATPDEVKAVFSEHRVIETGLQHGTLTLLFEEESLEITTFRIEAGYSDGRHPDAVFFTRSLREDLSRRDFTVNAMAYDPRVGLVDPFGGQEDVKKGLLRCVGESEQRFSEDALRILRLLRFASVLGFSVEEKTAAAARRLKDTLQKVSAERLSVELVKLLCGKDVRRVLLTYTDILGAFIPELMPMKGFDQRNPHHIYDVLTHTAVAVENTPPEPELRLAALFHDIGKPSTFTVDDAGMGHFYGHPAISAAMAQDILIRLKFDNATRNTVVRLVKWHDLPIEDNERGVKRALGKMTPVFFDKLILLKRADNKAQNPLFGERQLLYDRLEALKKNILAEQECFSLKDLAINGDDLLAYGMKQGKEIGTALSGLLDAVINENVPNEKEALLAYWKNINED